jgi:hypothetical protein
MWPIRARRYKTSGGRKETAAAAKQITGGKKKRGEKKSEPSKDDVRQMFDEIDGKYSACHIRSVIDGPFEPGANYCWVSLVSNRRWLRLARP